jgi:hypothetical protein
LDLRRRKCQEIGEDCIMRSFINVYASPDIRVIKSRRMRWAVHIARIGAMLYAHNILVATLKGRDHSENLSVDGDVILEWI